MSFLVIRTLNDVSGLVALCDLGKLLAIEELYIAMLHVLLVFLHCASRVSIRCKADISFSAWSTMKHVL